ncbi:glycosyltransferase family 4 protein [Aliamphritea ceti]|uniref:glycosyltransferase family 4 protein n=1 Tax=Aliamphritea ceti TaxID=1524258 RepID=UPI0021C28069|nr:glycosyltransferase family 4 protein [Aliamphritea ceti]
MTRLAIIRQRYRSDGGAERFVSQALIALSENSQLDVNVITRSWEGKPTTEYQVFKCDPKVSSRISREKDFATCALNVIAEEGFDLVQSHERIPGCDIYRAGDGVHKVWLEQRCRILNPIQRFWQGLSKYHKYVLSAEREMFNHPQLKAVICNSDMVKAEILQCFNAPPERIHVIHNAVDSERFCPVIDAEKKQLRNDYKLPEEANIAIYVGSGFQRKGLDAAIRAVALSGKYHLLVVGKDKKQSRYEALCKMLGIADKVHFIGVQQDTSPFYKLADVMLLPTLYDPFPNVILEAMSSGLPVITSTKCGGAEFIENGREGFVTDALDTAGISEALLTLDDVELRKSCGFQARKRVEKYDNRYLADRLSGLYQQLLISA